MSEIVTNFAPSFDWLQNHGVLAQLVERLNGIQKVRSSILLWH